MLATTYFLKTVLHVRSQKQSRGNNLVYSERKLAIFKVTIMNKHLGAAISSKLSF